MKSLISTLYLFILFYLLFKKTTTFHQSDSNYIVFQIKEIFDSQFISLQHEQPVINQRTHGGNINWRRGTDAQLQICANPVFVFVVLDV